MEALNTHALGSQSGVQPLPSGWLSHSRTPTPVEDEDSSDGDDEERPTILGRIGMGFQRFFGMVGRCRLPLSKPMLKAPIISALEAII